MFETKLFLNNILGMKPAVFLIVVAICVLIVLVVIYFYLASTFVNKNSVKIVERLGKYKKTLKPGWHLIVPLFDKVVASISTSQSSFSSVDNLTISILNSAYQLHYSLLFVISEPDKYFYSTNYFDGFLENITSSVLVEYFSKKTISSASDFYDFSKKEITSIINKRFVSCGINIIDFSITSVIKK